MKIFRFRSEEKIKTGVVIDSKHFEILNFEDEFDSNFIAENRFHKLSEHIKNTDKNLRLIEKEIYFEACVKNPSKIVCIGLNYVAHADETKSVPPKEPILFLKSTTALCGVSSPVIIPKNSVKTDYEVELACVIGKRASYVEENYAHNYIAGFTMMNDYSEREFQKERSGQWVKGKSADTFAPLGPYFHTVDEQIDYNNLPLWLKVNGQMRQESNTSQMIFKIPFLISYISQFMTLLPGDVISTGTPSGVALGMGDPLYIRDNDEIEYCIETIGYAKQCAKNYG